jgi:hypothetical protein
MIDTVAFPGSLMREQSVSWTIVASTVSGGQGGTGAFELVRFDGGGLWAAKLRGLAVTRREHVNGFRAIIAVAENGAVPLAVPRCDRRQAPVPIVGGNPVYSYDVPHSDDAHFDDGTPYDQPVIVILATFGAALRATALTVFAYSGGTVEAGQIFSIQHPTQDWRMYEIKTAVPNPGGGMDITFRPPLREAVNAGDAIEFDMPRCVMRLAAVPELELALRRFGAPDLDFVEFFYPDA